MQIQNNLYHQLQKLIWAAFVGVISFQLIVPQIWGYMNKLAGISYSTGYFLFITGYAALVPCLAIVWLIKNYGDIKKLLFPVGEPETDVWCTRYLYGVIGNCALQFVIFLSMLFLSYWIEIPYSVFLTIQLLGLISSGGSIILGVIIAKRRVDIEIQASTAGKKNEVQLRYSLKLTITACIAFFAVFAVWDGLYLWDKCKENYIPKNYYANTGFKLLETKDTISKYKNNIENNSLQLISSVNIDSLSCELAKYKDTLELARTATEKNKNVLLTNTSKPNKKNSATNKSSVTADKPVAQNKSSNSKISAAEEKIHSLTKQLNLHQLREDALLQWRMLDDIDSSRKPTDDIKTLTIQNYAIISKVSADKIPISDRHEYITSSKNYLNILEDKTKTTAQKILGKVMRDHQSKILFSLLNIFFALLALYMFLRMNSQIHNGALKSLMAKTNSSSIRDGDDKIVVRGDKSYTEREQLALEKNQAGSAELTEGAWFIIVITVWMMLPMFKPMEDKDIDTESPYKHFTLSPAIEKATGLDSKGTPTTIYYNSFNRQGETITRNIKGDTTIITNVTTIDIDSLKRTLDSIKNNVNNISERTGRIGKEVNGLQSTMKAVENKVNHIEP